MPTTKKIMQDVLSGRQDSNIKFADLQKLIGAIGFNHSRVRGDHFIYASDNIDEIINIQPNKNKAKAYQVKQIRNIILEYGLEV